MNGSLLPNVLAVFAVAFFIGGVVMLVRIPNRHLPIQTKKHARGLVRVYVAFEIGLGFLIASLWVGGSGPLVEQVVVGRVIATIAYIGLLVGLLPVLSRTVRVASDRETSTRIAAE